MIYEFNLVLYIFQYTYLLLRQPRYLAFARVLLQGISLLQSDFKAFRSLALIEARQNGQVAKLQNLLNNLYDNTLRRIRIFDNFFRTFVISNIVDLIISDATDTIIYTQPDFAAGVNFIVSFPNTDNKTLFISNESDLIISNNIDFIIYNERNIIVNNPALKATVNRYKIAGKGFEIQNI